MPFSNLKFGPLTTRTILLALLVLGCNVFLFYLVIASHGRVEYILGGSSFLFAVVLFVFLARSVYMHMHEHEQLTTLAQNVSLKRDQLAQASDRYTTSADLINNELPTPPQVIRGYASMLLDGTLGSLDDEARNASSKIFSLSEAMNVTSDQLLSTIRANQSAHSESMNEELLTHTKNFWAQKISWLQFLVVLSVAMNLAQFFFAQTPIRLLVHIFVVAIVVVSGFYLINETKNEPSSEDTIESLEKELEKLSQKLATIDEQSRAILSMVSEKFQQQLAFILDTSSRMSEGTLGIVSTGGQSAAGKISESSKQLTETLSKIKETLNVS